MTSPRVSVIIPTYNRGPLLEQAIASVQQHATPDLEILVIDHASTDNTLQCLEAISATEPRLRILRHRGPHGPAPARNTGLAAARGEWIAFLDSDDEWLPGKLPAFLHAIQDDVVLVGSNYYLIDDSTQPPKTMRDFLENVMIPWWTGDPLIRDLIDTDRLHRDIHHLADPDLVLMMTLGGYLWPQTSSVMVRTQTARAAGGFPARLKRTEDMVLWLNLLNRGRWIYIDEPLARYHISGRDHVIGPRYEHYDAPRRHDLYEDMLAHLRLLKTLPRRFVLSPAALRFHRNRLRQYHLYCADQARPNRPWAARWHRWQAQRLTDK